MKKVISKSFLLIGMLLIASCGDTKSGGDSDGIKNSGTMNSNGTKNNSDSSSANSNGVFTRDDDTNIVTQKKLNWSKMWQDDKGVIGLNNDRNDASSYCERLKLGGYSDWHLPSSYAMRGIFNDKTKRLESIFKNMNRLVARYWVDDYTSNDYRLQTAVWFSNNGKFEVIKGLGSTELSVRCYRNVKSIL